MPFKYISIFSSGGHFVHPNQMFCALLVEIIVGNIHV